MSLPKVNGSSMALVATTCPTCGTVKVYAGGVLLRKVSLYSPTRVDRALVPVVIAQVGHHIEGFDGRLLIKVVSSGKKVIIDGVAVEYWPWLS